jgi:hypothetical protein
VQRAHIKEQIYRMILGGNSYPDIMKFMHMPERSFYRYLSEIKMEEKTFLDSISPEEIAWQLRLMRDGLREDIQRMVVISSDPANRNAVAAQHLASEIRCTIPKIYTEEIISLIRTKDFPNNELNDKSKRTTMRLVPVKDPETQLPLRYQIARGVQEKAYDELDYPDGDEEDEEEEQEEE